MTNNARIIEKDGKWYFWPDAWTAAAGPFNEYIEAHAALTKYLEEHHDGPKNTGFPEEIKSTNPTM